ncbi:MAG: tRNA pseudouridine(13) synthase TruD [Planctomycetes bacterium]|nr:tRNA pseudouridine(13) synthase TruD [Planctomycetota bacterium]
MRRRRGAARAVEGDDLRVLALARHGRKLRAGQLAGNRFTLVVRGVRADELAPLAAALARAEVHGFANAFGRAALRRGRPRHELGAHLVRRAWRAALARFAAAPTWPPSAALDELREVLAREGATATAASRGSRRSCRASSRARARQLARRRGDFRGAARAGTRTLRFALSAWQAHGFERVLARRAARALRLRGGDLALGLDAARARSA